MALIIDLNAVRLKTFAIPLKPGGVKKISTDTAFVKLHGNPVSR